MADKYMSNEEYARRAVESEERERLVKATEEDILVLLYDRGVTIGEAERILDSIKNEMNYRARRLSLNAIMEPGNASRKNEKG